MEIDIATIIEHSYLDPAATPDAIRQCCAEAERYDFPAVCVYPAAVRLAAECLHQKTPRVCAAIAFPTGATTTAVKLYEAQEAVENGARELNVTINLAWLAAGKTDAIHREIAEICEATNQTVKAILETTTLSGDRQQLAAEICMDAGAAFVMTSTGWRGGATVADVRRLQEVTQGRIGIAASGGIQTLDQARALVEAGATRLATSRSLDLLREQEAA